MRVTEKGQVTIPKKIRERSGMRPGCEVEFDVKGDTVILRRVSSRARPGMTRGERIVAGIRGSATANRNLSTDEIMKLLRGND